ncbi:MAG: DNA primase [Polyangiaceae bacterium]|nr:DNA primase [Polyangiaceae bacterium]
MISADTLEQIKRRTDLVALIGEAVRLTRRGRSWVGLCPFHKEKSPSFHVTPERGRFHCFGCNEGGNAFDFVMKTEGLSFPEAARRLAERAGVVIEESGTHEDRSREAAQRRARDDLFSVMHVAAVYFEKMLQEHPDARVARDELEKRRLVAEAPTDRIATALSAFRLGYAPAGWDGLAQYLREQGVSPALGEQVGLLAPRKTGAGHYDRFRNRLMFAVLDLQGRVVAFSGRILPDPQTGLVDKETGKYVNSPETPIYRKGETVFGLFQARQGIRQVGEAVIVEGNFDVVSLHARGVDHVVAPLGTAFTPEQAQLIKRFAPTVTLLFDGDAAGQKAVRRAQDAIKRAGLVGKAATLPPGKDPDDLARERGADGVRAVLRQARGLLEHLIQATLDESFAQKGVEERAQRLKEVAALLAAEDDPAVRGMAKRFVDTIVGELAMADPELGMVDAKTFGALERQVHAALRAPEAPTRDAPRPPRDLRVEAALGALLDFPELLDDDDVAPRLAALDGDAVLVVAALQAASRDALDVEALLAEVPPQLHDAVARRLDAPRHVELEPAKLELLANLEKIRVRQLTIDIRDGQREAAKQQAAGDDDAALELLRELSARAKQKRGIAT